MIGRLSGEIAHKQAPFLLLDVNGVGYELEAPMSTFYQLPAVDSEVILHTHLIVREDAQILCGFATESERRLFRSLIRITGVGAKLALAILSGMSADEFTRCVQDNDAASLTRLPGVGKKTAERLIIEMRDKLADWQSSEATAAPHAAMSPVTGWWPEAWALRWVTPVKAVPGFFRWGIQAHRSLTCAFPFPSPFRRKSSARSMPACPDRPSPSS